MFGLLFVLVVIAIAIAIQALILRLSCHLVGKVSIDFKSACIVVILALVVGFLFNLVLGTVIDAWWLGVPVTIAAYAIVLKGVSSLSVPHTILISVANVIIGYLIFFLIGLVLAAAAAAVGAAG